MHTCIHAYMHTYIHTFIHTYMHAYMHTYIHIYIYIYVGVCFFTHNNIYIYHNNNNNLYVVLCPNIWQRRILSLGDLDSRFGIVEGSRSLSILRISSVSKRRPTCFSMLSEHRWTSTAR